MKTVVDTSGLPAIDRPGRICILQSKWYPELVQSMTEACQQVLGQAGYTDIHTHTLPGSLEIPLAARDLLAQDVEQQIDAIICFGVIIKGDTLHFEMISEESMRGLGSVMHDFRRPVVVEILPVFTDAAGLSIGPSDDEFNKGIEAAVAAIEMVAWRRSIGASP
jgi:6,7-dimethyl-8-ribityllumazine synthase